MFIKDGFSLNFNFIHQVSQKKCRFCQIYSIRLQLLLELQIIHNSNCVCGTGNEDSEHFLLHCPQFNLMCMGLFSQLAVVAGLDITSMDSNDFCYCTEIQI